MKILFLTGAGISAESGLATFRSTDALWDKYKISDFCSPSALLRNPQQVFDFYNFRRRQLLTVEPNIAHLAIKELEQYHDVQIITTNVDDLHERAGSTNVFHLHGELLKSRDMETNKVFDWKEDIHVGTLSIDGNQLRPHIVFFHENVPAFDEAVNIAAKTQFDYLIIVGTSLQVYPANTLVDYVTDSCRKLIVDIEEHKTLNGVELYLGTATEQVPKIVEFLKGLK
jgi:NAD-dependent deacetylase